MNTKTATLITLTILLTIIPLATANEDWGINVNDWQQFQTKPTTTPYPTATPTQPPTSTPSQTATNNPTPNNPSTQSTPNPTIPETNTLTITTYLIITIITILIIKIKGSKTLPSQI
jgi:hypothetical protein